MAGFYHLICPCCQPSRPGNNQWMPFGL